MNNNAMLPAAPPATHPSFPPNQAFLWLPGLPGGEEVYCSYNRHSDSAPDPLTSFDANGAFLSNPYPVNQTSHVAWNRETMTPVPYHPIPVTRSLKLSEILRLATAVHLLMGDKPGPFPRSAQILKNWNRPYILAVLREMQLLA